MGSDRSFQYIDFASYSPLQILNNEHNSFVPKVLKTIGNEVLKSYDLLGSKLKVIVDREALYFQEAYLKND